MKPMYVIGIDEVGRGPVAGPVTVGAVLMPRTLAARLGKNSAGLKDSKKLSERKREEWFEFARADKDTHFATASVSAAVIDRVGISAALRLAIARALNKLQNTRHKNVKHNVKHRVFNKGKNVEHNVEHRVFNINDTEVLLDGLLRAPEEYRNQKTIIRGDEKEPAIMLASIVAKVTRDRKMRHFDRKFPEYGLKDNKGYGTTVHIKAIKRFGLIEIHRRSFLSRVICRTTPDMQNM